MTIAKLPSKPKAKVVAKVEVAESKKRVIDFDSPAARNLIESAPDGSQKTSRWKLKGKKVIITHSIDPEDLERLDALAQTMGISRAGLINLLIRRELMKEHEIY